MEAPEHEIKEQSDRLDNTHLEEGEVVLRCRPLWEDGKRAGIVREGLRCRFTKDSEQVDVPVLPGDSLDELLCKCNAEFTTDGTKVAILLPNGDELSCESMSGADQVKGVPAAGQIYKQLSFLDRYLFIWIFLVMGLALLIGYYVGGIKKHLSVVEIASVSLPIAIGLWVMMYPVLCKVRYELLWGMMLRGSLRKNILISLVLNWLIGPALMTALAWATLPDLPDYRTGVILIGIARCIAMVLIWNELARGDSQLCAVIVAVNSILQIALFTPVSLFYLEVVSRGKGIDVSAWTVAKSVLLFLGVPLGAGILTRLTLRRGVGPKWYDTKFIPFIGPFALLGLLYTILVMFAIQAHEIVDNIGEVLRVVVPLILYFAITFTSSVLVTRHLKLPYPEIVTQSFTAASNNFELAIAVAVGAFGIDSHEALAATIGPLIEVPVLLLLVYVTLFFQKWLSRS
ncbi:hypothetical protein R1sor_006537 [Riccia sorocarpa]|uniref:Arsenite transporter n=1 Tax=Riccia sorocarpa TaxID=122646 RepID=A0ABD3HPZ0_9MARC